MKITLDATALLSRPFGIGQYAANLVAALAHANAGDDYTLLYQCVRDAGRDFQPPQDPRFRRRLLRLPLAAADLVFGTGGMKGDAACGKPDVYHAMRNFLPRFSRAKSVWTCYDVSFKVEPEWFTPETARGLDERARTCLDRADHVIAISRHTKEDIVRLYGYPADRVTSILLGASASSLAATDLPRGIPRPYILFVGTLEPRKNVARLVHAFSSLDLPHALVLAGAKGWRCDDVFHAIESSPRRSRIVWLDYVAPPLLGALYRNAEIFIYPSLYEGFGIPLLEAMTHGCPVITTRLSSLPEVAGDAALYADPMDESEMAGKIRMLASDRSLRDDFSARGRARAAAFTWDETARRTIDIYHSLATKT